MRRREPQTRPGTWLSREEFAKIIEVDGHRLSDAMRAAFEDFDRLGLSAEERRQAIIERFKPTPE
jgi:hypothetical protein